MEERINQTNQQVTLLKGEINFFFVNFKLQEKLTSLIISTVMLPNMKIKIVFVLQMRKLITVHKTTKSMEVIAFFVIL